MSVVMPDHHGGPSTHARTVAQAFDDLPFLVQSRANVMDDVVWLDLHRHALSPIPRAGTGARAAGSGQWRAVWRGIATGIYLTAMMIMTSRPGTAWARSDADDVLEIPVHPDLPTSLRLPDAVTRARVTGGSIPVTFAGRTLHIRPRAGVSAGLEALLEVETVTIRLTFRLRVVERYQDARAELVVVALPSEHRAEESPPEGETAPAASPDATTAASPDATTPAAGAPVADASPEIPVHPRVTTILLFPDEIVRARFTGLVTGMMRATNLDDRLLIRPSPGLSVGTEVPVLVQTATVRQRFRLRVVPRTADAWRHVVVLAPTAAASPATPTPPEPPATTAPTALARAVRMMLQRFTARDAETWAPMPVAPTPGHAAAPATERAGAATHPRVDISIHAVVALAGTTELTRPGYQATQARQSHRAFGIRVAGRRPGASWGVEANVSGEWPVAPTRHTRNPDTELEMRGPWLRADVGLKAWFGTRLVPTASVGLGLQAHHRDVDVNEPDEAGRNRSQVMPFGGGAGREHGARVSDGESIAGSRAPCAARRAGRVSIHLGAALRGLVPRPRRMTP